MSDGNEKRVYIKIKKKGEGDKEIGSWEIPDVSICNWEAQRDIGWHIFYEIEIGCDSVEVFTR